MADQRNVASDAAYCNGHVSASPPQSSARPAGDNQTVTADVYTHNSNNTAVQAADAAASGTPDQAARQADSSALQQACFSEELVGVRVCFQLVDLGRQLYVWAGSEGGAMGCMCLASPPAGGAGLPPVATLVRGTADSAAASVAQRLARKTGRSVAVAWALPDQPPMLNILAERRIVQQLTAVGLVQRNSDPSGLQWRSEAQQAALV